MEQTVVTKKTSTVSTSPDVVVTQGVPPTHMDENPQSAYKKKKAIFRYYQAVWYVLGIIEALLFFRFFFKLIGADPSSPIVSLIYALSAPFAIPFLGVTSTQGVNNNVFEFSTLIACLFYLIIAWGIVKLAQFIKPTSHEEVEMNVRDSV